LNHQSFAFVGGSAEVDANEDIQLGLAAVPFLPFVFDEPIEHATEWVFYNAFKAIGGPKAVEGRLPMGNHHRPGDAPKEKEL
jgi:fission process protein 1